MGHITFRLWQRNAFVIRIHSCVKLVFHFSSGTKGRERERKRDWPMTNAKVILHVGTRLDYSWLCGTIHRSSWVKCYRHPNSTRDISILGIVWKVDGLLGLASADTLAGCLVSSYKANKWLQIKVDRHGSESLSSASKDSRTCYLFPKDLQRGLVKAIYDVPVCEIFISFVLCFPSQ